MGGFSANVPRLAIAFNRIERPLRPFSDLILLIFEASN